MAEPEIEAGSRRLRMSCALGRLLNDLLTPAARRRGFAETAVLAEWERIVGTMLAKRCQPIRLVFAPGTTTHGVLHLRARGGAALELQHAAVEIVERINDYMGFPAVFRLHLVQVPLAPSALPVRRRPPAAPDPLVERRLQDQLGAIDQGTLREALQSLGRAITARRSG